MNHPAHLAIIGSGASSIYLLKHLLEQSEVLKRQFAKISIFEKSSITGMGMPYSPRNTDLFNMSNISSEEIPELIVSFGDWLRSQSPAVLEELDLADQEISDSEVYNRLALGRYLASQYEAIIERIAAGGIAIDEHPGCEIIDIRDFPDAGKVTITTAEGKSHDFHQVVIATGHYWKEEDHPESGYYASPWPIFKLLPEHNHHHNFAIGTLGASLSAFDVISSLAHRHGKFSADDPGRWSFHPDPGTEDFKIIMHASNGLLPHLQFDQENAFREIYRHVDRDGLLKLIDPQGFLRIETYFDKVCRPALGEAFKKDNMQEMVGLLADPDFHLKDFVEKMTDEHDYPNAFEGMRLEMVEAKQSVLCHQPIHWKEVIDDLMYTLNFHAELLPAEDHLVLKSEVMPFLMNVIAAMPLDSGNTLLALYDAGKLDIVSGKASIAETQEQKGMTTIMVDDEGRKSTMNYRMFIDCSGQKPLELAEYPFPGLVDDQSVRKARAAFANPESAAKVPEEKKENLFQEAGEWFYQIGGIDIDGAYRLIGCDGKPNPRIYEIAFPHTPGVRPYSYGLQACSDTSAILVQSWVDEFNSGSATGGNAKELTKVYEKVSDPV